MIIPKFSDFTPAQQQILCKMLVIRSQRGRKMTVDELIEELVIKDTVDCVMRDEAEPVH